MRYIIIAILIYLGYLFVKRFLGNISAAKKKNIQDDKTASQKKTYDVNLIQDAEFREVKKD